MTTGTSSLATILKQNNQSVTKARQAVFKAMLDSGPLSMAQLTNKVHTKVDRASVYRTIELFERLGIVNRLQIGWKYQLELSDLFTDHHHHITCTQCGKVVSFEESRSFDKEIQEIATNLGFTPTAHCLEIKGLCHTCTQKH